MVKMKEKTEYSAAIQFPPQKYIMLLGCLAGTCTKRSTGFVEVLADKLWRRLIGVALKHRVFKITDLSDARWRSALPNGCIEVNILELYNIVGI